MSKGKKALKVIGKIFASLIALIILVYIVLNIIFGIQLNNTIAELKAQGKPMTIAEIVPLPVPDEENAALLYNKAFILMTSGEGGIPYIPNKEMGTKNNVIKAIEEVKSYSDISEWTDEQKQEIPKLINSQELREIYALLEEGSKRPKCNFNPKYEEGPGMLLPYFTPMRSAMRLLCVRAMLEAESGENAQAFDTLLVGFKISNQLKDEPILITQLVRIACDGMIIRSIEDISDSKGIPAEKANLIINELSLHQGVEPFIKCMDGEKLIYMGWLAEKVLKGNMSWRELQTMNGECTERKFFVGEKILSSLILHLYRPIFKKDYECNLTFLSKMQDSYNIPYYEYVKDEITEEDVPMYCVLTKILMPALGRVREIAARYQADIDICRTGLALKLYKAKNGNYPEGLESLVSAKLLKEVPVDPFSGKSLVYSRYIGGFKLYSFGPNMQDDFGTKRTKEKDSPAYENYDLVWQSES